MGQQAEEGRTGPDGPLLGSDCWTRASLWAAESQLHHTGARNTTLIQVSEHALWGNNTYARTPMLLPTLTPNVPYWPLCAPLCGGARLPSNSKWMNQEVATALHRMVGGSCVQRLAWVGQWLHLVERHTQR